MVINKQRGNMYGFVTHTWNPIKGKCMHDCSYCYMKRFPQKPIRLVEKELKDNLGEGNFIFVGSSTDMFAKDVPNEWIWEVMKVCNRFPKNTYLFQSKNPQRFIFFNDVFPENVMLCTTMETNRQELLNCIGIAPPIFERSDAMTIKDYRKMITIEPILDFDVIPFVSEIRRTHPEVVNIGADSKGHHLPEPSWEKIQELIKELEKFTKVNQKCNLKRLEKNK